MNDLGLSGSAVAAADESENISDHLELLAVMGRDFSSTLDIDATILNALEHIIQHLDAEGGAVFLLEDEGRTLHCTSCVGATDITGLKLKSDQGIVGRSVQDNKGEIVRNVAEDPNFEQSVDEKTGFTTRSILCAPMSVKDEKIGAIELVNKSGGDGLFSQEDLQILEVLSSSAALAILNARMTEALVEQERVRRELELAAEIQRSLLPDPPQDGFPLYGVNIPARMVSGDFYDFFELDDGRICFNLGDVSGKGMNAALLMAKTASIFRCLGKTVSEPGRLMSLVNAEICETATRGMFVTMVGGVLEPRTGRVVLASAGHEPSLFRHPDGTFTSIEAEAPPLGIAPPLSPDDVYPETELMLDEGSLYIFSDGVTEGYLADGGMLESSGLKSLLDEYSALPVRDRLDKVVAVINRGDGALRDDLTLLAIEDDREAATKESQTQKDAAAVPDGEEMLVLEFPARPDRLKLVRNAVSETASLCGCDEAVSRDMVIAVDEACQNVIRHAYGAKNDGAIVLEIRRGAGEIVFLLRDFADEIDVAAVQPRDLQDIRPGGLGTHFMREVMDEVAFMPTPSGGGNLLKMTKRIA